MANDLVEQLQQLAENQRLFDRSEKAVADLAAARARIAELEAGLRLGLDLISPAKGWGTYPRMEGVAIYEEAGKFEEVARSLLSEQAEG